MEIPGKEPPDEIVVLVPTMTRYTLAPLTTIMVPALHFIAFVGNLDSGYLVRRVLGLGQDDRLISQLAYW